MKNFLKFSFSLLTTKIKKFQNKNFVVNRVRSQLQCHDFDIEHLRRLQIANVLTLAVFIALHVRNLLNIINILVQSLSISLCALHSWHNINYSLKIDDVSYLWRTYWRYFNNSWTNCLLKWFFSLKAIEDLKSISTESFFKSYSR